MPAKQQSDMDKMAEFCDILSRISPDKKELLLAMLRLPVPEMRRALRVLGGERPIPEGMTPAIDTENAQFWFANDDLVDELCERGGCLSLAPLIRRATPE